MLRRLVYGALAALIAVTLAGTGARAAGEITITFPDRLASGPDYATDVLGDPWDMCNPQDISPFPNELIGFASFNFLTSPCRAGGQTNSNDASVSLLYRGIYPAIDPGRNGKNFPIDTSKYQVISYKLDSPAGELPQIYWFHNSFQHPSGNALGRIDPGVTTAGKQIKVASLTQPAIQGANWTSAPQVLGLRFDPNSNTSGNNAFIHWVRLTPAAGTFQQLSWAGPGTGTTTITVTDSDGTVFTVASGTLSSPYNFNYGVLPPGTYTLSVLRAGGTSGTKVFSINRPPTIQVTDPSPTTGEDYATRVLNNPWDMSDAADLQITGVEHSTPISFSGGMAHATNTNSDPNVTLLNSANSAVPIDTAKYRYLTYRFQIDSPFSLELGSVARVFWSADANLATPTTSKDILVWPGMNSYTIDLATLTTAGGGGLEPFAGAQTWTAAAKRNLRFDPHEMPNPVGYHIDDVKLTAKPEATGLFTIKFAGNDADGDPTTVAVYYDTDTNPNNGKTLILSGVPLGTGQVAWNTKGVPQGDYFIYAEANDTVQVAGQYSTVPVHVVPAIVRPADFDGDGVTDVTIFRPSNGEWYVLQSSLSTPTAIVKQWGLPGDMVVPADYDGDGKTDMAQYRPSNGGWYILKSSTGFSTWSVYQWGLAGDIPMPGDYDGDDKADPAVYRPSDGTWYVLKSTTAYSNWGIYQWGLNGDRPMSGDFDGDGRVDPAVYRPSDGTWYILRSTTGHTNWSVYQWGLNGDVPMPGDYDGDGRADPAVFRPSDSTWYLLKSTANYAAWGIYPWGIANDVPVTGDYDGDRRIDLTVFRPSTRAWYVLKSSTNFTTAMAAQWGLSGDQPIALH